VGGGLGQASQKTHRGSALDGPGTETGGGRVVVFSRDREKYWQLIGSSYSPRAVYSDYPARMGLSPTEDGFDAVVHREPTTASHYDIVKVFP